MMYLGTPRLSAFADAIAEVTSRRSPRAIDVHDVHGSQHIVARDLLTLPAPNLRIVSVDHGIILVILRANSSRLAGLDIPRLNGVAVIVLVRESIGIGFHRKRNQL